MTQMRVQITTPYGVVTRDFPEDERDVIETGNGEVLATSAVVEQVLGQAERFTHEVQANPLIGYASNDEHDFTIGVVRTILGRQSIELLLFSAQDPSFYDLPKGVEFSEVDAYELDQLPFEVVVEDVTGQLYDEFKDRVEA